MNIVTLTLSCAFDIHCSADEFERDRENLATVTDHDAGGKGVNISRALTLFGVKNKAVAVLGEENADSFARTCREDNIDLYRIDDVGRIRENITIHTKDGRETRLSFRGTPASHDILDKVRALLDKLCDSDTVLTVTGRVPDGIDMDDVKRLIRDFSEKGVRVVVDSRSFTLDDLIEVKPFLIKPNEEEIGTYMQRNICNFEDSLAASEELRARGIENVMISLGAKGASLSSSDGAFVAPAPKIDPISTIGAGDSSIAGFLMGLSLGESYEDCLRRAVAFGTAACLTSGTRPPRASDVERFLKEREI